MFIIRNKDVPQHLEGLASDAHLSDFADHLRLSAPICPLQGHAQQEVELPVMRQIEI